MTRAARSSRISRVKILAFAVSVGLAALALLSMSPGASARTNLWGGSGANDVGPGTILFKVQNGRATIKSIQAVMACTDTSDGSESDRAFDVANGPTDTLNRNRFNFNFTRYSLGRQGHIRLTGRFGSNGRGSARLVLNAVGRDFESDSVIERCQATVNYRLRRGPAH